MERPKRNSDTDLSVRNHVKDYPERTYVIGTTRDLLEYGNIPESHRENSGWLRRFRGAFNDRPEFDEVARLGREICNTDRQGQDEPAPS